MVRKIICVVIILPMILTALCSVSLAVDYTTYDGNISSTYTTYFKDILSNVSINDNYVYFRSGQYTYDLVVGDLSFSNGVFTLSDSGVIYTITTNNNYNGYYSYSSTSIDNFTLDVGDKIVYSDIGDYPSLEERSEKFEIIQTILLCSACLCVVIRSIFNSSRRRL